MPETISASEYQELSRKKMGSKPSKEKASIELALKAIGLPFEREYLFAPDRKFRADYCLPDHRILIEYEGLIYNNNRRGSSGKSRHTTIKGFTGDIEKYNIATLLGFRMLRYTAKTYKQVYSDVMSLITGAKPKVWTKEEVEASRSTAYKYVI